MSRFPDFAVGDLWTADAADSMLPMFVRKANDETVTSNASVQDDDELFLSVEANASYFMDGWFIHSAVSNTPDLRLNYSYPAGASFTRSDWAAPDTTTASADSINNTVATTTDNTRGSGTVTRAVYVRGELIVGSTAGTFKVRWSQATSSVDGTTMKAGSRLILTRYA